MQIQSINNFSNIKSNQNPQFKSVIPVVHWLAETNGSFSPQIKINIARELNENIISRLNVNRLKVEQKIAELTKKVSELTEKIKTARSEREKVAKEKKIAMYRTEIADLRLTERVQNYVAGRDPEYAKKPIARNFYNEKGYADRYGHEAAVYIATGNDALYLDSLGRDIGIAKRNRDSRAIERACSDYWSKGGKMVEKRQKDFKLPTGEEAELHVKMEILRDIAGEKTGYYNITDMRRFPKTGPNNPFALIDWMKS